MCKADGCEREPYRRGECSLHYLRMQKYGTYDESALQKPGPAADPTKPYSKHRAPKGRKFATDTHCAKGHEFTLQNTYVYPETSPNAGQKVCKICNRNAHQRYKGLPEGGDTPVGPRNGDKTHCKQGHEYNERNTRRKNDGSRGCNECNMRGFRKRRYGVEWTAVERMLIEQSGRCWICTEPFHGGTFAIDHFHDTGQVRGLLCNNCNNGLGRFNDSPTRLIAAAEYLLAGESWRTSA